MDVSQLTEDWSTWRPHLQGAFPHSNLPDIFPRAALGPALIERIAQAHDLTPAEVQEMIADIVLHNIGPTQAEPAAA